MAVIPALFGLLLAALVSGQTVDITPRQAVRRVGDELTVLCKVPYQIDSCRMTVGKTPYRLRPNKAEGDVVYAGQGLEAGECGAHIRHVQEEWNGDIICTLPPSSGNIEVTATMRLLVARAPGAPELISSQQPAFKEGDQFEAQCVVGNGRPAAKISWFLDEEPLLTGIHQPVVDADPATDLQTIRQNLSRTLTAEDESRRLVCRAEHEALDAPREASRQLIVHYPPKRVEGDSSQLTIFGLKLGAEGRLNVTVRASPAPRPAWTLGDQRLAPHQHTHDGALTALPPIALGGGYYNITLILAKVSKEDVERTYFLRVTNDLGREEYSIRISTMDEPAGVELDTGAIVGIVVAVLVLLIAVFLVVFAKATDRWCFAGGSRGRDLTKSSGESTPAGDVLLTGIAARTSDTESAVGGRAARAGSRLVALGARVRAALPRPRDKVQAAEGGDGDEKQLSEEKKGVVYAELALGEQAQGDKPPPPSTEYAEIVYTDQQKEVKE